VIQSLSGEIALIPNGWIAAALVCRRNTVAHLVSVTACCDLDSSAVVILSTPRDLLM
jgi:hypothetical protein